MTRYIWIVFLFLTACVSSEFAAVRDKSADKVRAIKGEPITIIHENGYEMWTYRQGECRQFVFFNEEGKATDWYELGECVQPQ